MKTEYYSTFLKQISVLIGIPVADLDTDMKAALNAAFNSAIRKAWKACNWVDLCPYGEERTTNADGVVSWAQASEDEIDVVFNVWSEDPATPATLPDEQPYRLTSDGIQTLNPVIESDSVWIHYRKRTPSFRGDDFDVDATYAADAQVLYEDADGNSNFYKCLSSTSAGQDPEDTPAKWELIEIPEVLFWFTVHQAFAEWLTGDGQNDKAAGQYALAQMKLDDELDKQERQMGVIMPTTFTTHVSSQTR